MSNRKHIRISDHINIYPGYSEINHEAFVVIGRDDGQNGSIAVFQNEFPALIAALAEMVNTNSEATEVIQHGT